MFKKTILALAFTLLLAGSAGANIMREISEAACRISAGRAYGSGTAISMDETNVYVLSNAHVVGSSRTVAVEFWKFGRKVPQKISGTVIRRHLTSQLDFAIISVPKTSFTVLPRLIPLLPSKYIINSPGTYVATAGCPEAQWLSVKEGYLMGPDSKRCGFRFRPVAQNGQSGSGLFTKVNGTVYIMGIVTARTSPSVGRPDRNGFDTVFGIAYDIHNVQKALQSKAAFVDTGEVHVAATGLYVKDSDGKYWPQNEDGSVNVPPGTQIVEWNCPPQQQQQQRQQQQQQAPPNLMPLPGPVLPKPQQGGGGYGAVPPGFGDPPTIVLPPKENPLKIELEAALKLKVELEKSLADKTAEVEGLQATIDEQAALILQLQAQVEESTTNNQAIVDLLHQAETQIVGLKAQIVTDQESVTNITLQLEQKDTQIQQYITQINKYEEVLNELVVETPVVKEEDKGPGFLSRTWQKVQGISPMWWGLLGMGGALLFTKGKALAAVPKLISSVFKKKEEVQTVANNISDGALRDILNDHFANTTAQIDAISAKLKMAQPQPQVADANQHVTVNIDNDNSDMELDGAEDLLAFVRGHNKPESLERVKQFFELKQRDGESVEQWAFFALLYKEAMQLLRQGKFTIGVVGTKITLQGQRLTAEKIDVWVRDQYIKRTSINQLKLDYIYQEAMLGFLYQEAVKLLRAGGLPVLGAKETANTIENWVKQEFLQRMGINL